MSSKSSFTSKKYKDRVVQQSIKIIYVISCIAACSTLLVPLGGDIVWVNSGDYSWMPFIIYIIFMCYVMLVLFVG